MSRARIRLRRLVGVFADPVVPLVLELLGELRAAALDDFPVEHDVDVVGLDVVEDALVVGDLEDAGALLVAEGVDPLRDVLQAALLEPSIAVLDEIDSGLDIDRLQDVSKGINALRDEQGTGILQITHYQRILDYVEPDHVHVMLDGKVAKSGGAELAEELEDKGYDWVRDEVYEAA